MAYRTIFGSALLALTLGPVSPAAAASSGAVAGTQVRIQRDANGVPHIFANSTYAIFYGVGYAAAEDKLYQLDILRRTAEGRVAEVFGSSYLKSDQAARHQIDLGDLDRQFRALAPDDQAIFRGFAAGFTARVNAVLAQRGALLSKDFRDAAILPQPWRAIDVLAVFVHSMALRFSDINFELDNLALLTRLRQGRSPEAAAQLFDELRWVSDDSATSTVPPDAWRGPIPTRGVLEGRDLPNGLKPLGDEILYSEAARVASLARDPPHASNAWLIGPQRTAHGEAILVNGPQMGDNASSYIWAVGLHGAGFNVVGSGPIGSPWLIFGTNGDIGWGATAGLGDTVDIYQEQLSASDPHAYLFKGGYRQMTVRNETIQVKGGQPFHLPVYSTAHGPVDLFDPHNGVAYSRKRSWAGSEAQSLVAWVRAMQTHDYTSWRRAVAKVQLTVNNYYIDRSGHIAYQFLGRFPQRPPNQDFRLPVRGDGTMEWRGFYATLDNPGVIDPKRGYLVNWNNKPAALYNNSDYMFWSRVDRVDVLAKAVSRLNRATPDDAWDVIRQSAFLDVTAPYYQSLVRASDDRFEGDARKAAAILLAWDGKADDPATGRTGSGYLLYKTFLGNLLREIFSPLLPVNAAARAHAEKELLDTSSIFPGMGAKAAYRALSEDHASPLLAGRVPSVLIAQALGRSYQELASKLGADPAGWTEPARRHVFSKLNYAGIPETTEPGEIALPIFMNRGTENNRIVAANGKLSYCDVTPPGESGSRSPDGRPAPHARDQLDLYRSFGCKPQWLSPEEVNRHTVSTRTLSISPLARPDGD